MSSDALDAGWARAGVGKQYLRNMQIAVMGTGHVGLPTAASLAHLGHDVVATDTDDDKIKRLQQGELPFYELGLGDLVHEGLAAGRLSFTSDPAEAIAGARVVFLCVGTPPKASGEANLLAVERAAETVADHASDGVVVVEKSTVPAGTAERVAEVLARGGRGRRFHVVSNPEFLREGSAIEDSLHPWRILVGSDSPEALAVMRELYAPLIDHGAGWIETDVTTAELAKHACNAFLAVKISFANALARLCDAAGADVESIAEVLGSDPRVGRAFLNAGLGYGGYCLPKDIAAFERLADKLGYDFPLLRDVAKINDEAVDAAMHKIERALWNLDEKRIALLGLAFKPGTDDVRFAPALVVAQRLIEEGARVVGFDPQAGDAALAEVPDLEIVDDVYRALDGADCAVICTEWDEFRNLDLSRARELMTSPIIVDGRNVFDPARMRDLGFTYLSMGRPPVEPQRQEA